VLTSKLQNFVGQIAASFSDDFGIGIYAGANLNYEEILVSLGNARVLILIAARDDYFIPVPNNSDITRAIEEDHRTWVFVDRGLVRNFFYVDIEDGAGGKIDSLGVHQVAFKEGFDPTAVFGNAEDDASGVFDRVNYFFAGKSITHAIDL
jgi:hypothetical protein